MVPWSGVTWVILKGCAELSGVMEIFNILIGLVATQE